MIYHKTYNLNILCKKCKLISLPFYFEEWKDNSKSNLLKSCFHIQPRNYLKRIEPYFSAYLSVPILDLGQDIIEKENIIIIYCDQLTTYKYISVYQMPLFSKLCNQLFIKIDN